MNCEQVIDAIQKVLDENPSATWPEAVAAHVEHCADCRRLCESLRDVESHIGEVYREEDAEPPRSLHAGIMRAVARQDRGARVAGVRPLRSVVAVVVAAAAVVAGVFAVRSVLIDLHKTPDGPKSPVETAFPLQIPSFNESLPNVDLELASEALIREALSSERVARLVKDLPVPKLSGPKLAVPEMPWPRLALGQSETITAAAGEVTQTFGGFWDYGRETIRLLSGQPMPGGAAEING